MKNKPLKHEYRPEFFTPGLMVSWLDEFSGKTAVAMLTGPGFFIAAVNFSGDSQMDPDEDGDMHRIWWSDELPSGIKIHTANQAEVNKFIDLLWANGLPDPKEIFTADPDIARLFGPITYCRHGYYVAKTPAEVLNDFETRLKIHTTI